MPDTPPETPPDSAAGSQPEPTALDLAWSVLVPGLRWVPDRGAYARDLDARDPDARPGSRSDACPDAYIDRGAAGLILFGGEAEAAHEEIDRIRSRASRPLLFAADLERGAGQQFDGATPLPPAGALGALDRLEVTRAAARLTAREARAIGLDVVFAPVADVASEPDNPIVGPRAFSSQVNHVARHTAAWVAGAMQGGAWPCAKHFPGHGRTREDSHVGGVSLEADRATVEAEWAPFAAAIQAGVPMIMTAHVAVPSLDPTGRPATRSGAILQRGLRETLGFDGLIVTDALLMAGAGGESEAAVEAIGAGVDLLLYPKDPTAVAEALARSANQDPVLREALKRASARVRVALREMAERRRAGIGGPDDGESRRDTPARRGPGWGDPADEARAAKWARESVRWTVGQTAASGGEPPPHPPLSTGTRIHILEVDDDLGGPYPPPSRAPFRERLAETVQLVGRDAAEQLVLTVWADTRGWKGRAGLSPASAAAVGAALADAPDRPVHLVLFGGDRPARDLPAGVGHWLAWGGEARMQRAAADRLTGPGEAGSLPGDGRAE